MILYNQHTHTHTHTGDDKYGYFINQNMHGDDPLFTNFHASSTFPRYLDDIRDTCERGGYVRVMHTCRDEPGKNSLENKKKCEKYLQTVL